MMAVEGKSRGWESGFIGRKPWESSWELFTSEIFLARVESQCISSNHLSDLLVQPCDFDKGIGTGRTDPGAPQRCGILMQTSPKAQYRYKATAPLIAKHPKHTTLPLLQAERLPEFHKTLHKRILLLSIRLLILKLL